MTLFLIYWILTTIYGVYWLVKHPSSRHGDDDDEEIQFEKGKGSLYIFDSNLLHKVNPITNGIRYSINCWPKYSIKKTLI